MSAHGEDRPLGMMVPPVPAGHQIPPEPPDVAARQLAVAARLLCGASTFFFLAFLFAYIYLRSLNQDGMWRPPHEHPNQAWGAVFIACIVLSALTAIVSGRRMKAKSASWLPAVIGALVLAIVAVIAQCIEYTVQNFGPTDGAYASVFCAWSAFYLIAILFTMFWFETQIATELRARRSPAPANEGDVKEPDRLIAPGLDAAVFLWTFMAGIGIVTYVTLYLA